MLCWLLNDIFKFELMNLERGHNGWFLSFSIAVIAHLAVVQTCTIDASFGPATFLTSNLSSGITINKNGTWATNGSANVTVTADNLNCSTICSFQPASSSRRTGSCSISSKGNGTSTISWKNIDSSKQLILTLFSCSFLASKDHLYRSVSYSFIYQESVTQTCSYNFTTTPGNLNQFVKISKNSSYVDQIALLSLNLFNLDFANYPSSLYFNISNFTPIDNNVTISYSTPTATQNQTINITTSNNVTIFGLFTTDNTSSPTFRLKVTNIYLQLRTVNLHTYQPYNANLGLIYTFDNTNYTILSGSSQFTNTDPFTPIYNGDNQPASNSTFNLTAVDQNVTLRANQQLSFYFNISVNRTNCLPDNYALCLNLFDQINIALYNQNSAFQFVSSTSGDTFFPNNANLNPQINTRLSNTNITFSLLASNLAQGINQIYFTGINGTSNSTQVSIECYQSINGNLTPVGNPLNFTLYTQLVTTFVQNISLIINDLNGTYPSQLNQPQQFNLIINLSTPLSLRDYVVIKVPAQYTFNRTIVTPNSNDSLCVAGQQYRCFNGNQNNSNQIWVTGNFSNTTLLNVSIANSTFLSPKSWANFTAFQANTYFYYNVTKDAYNSSITIRSTFYLNCSNQSSHCKDCDSAGNCRSCYPSDLSFPMLFNNTCVQQCPVTYFSMKVGTGLECNSCGIGCNVCTNSTYCQTCSDSYFPEQYKDNFTTNCVKKCSSGRLFVNNNCNTINNQTASSNSTKNSTANSTASNSSSAPTTQPSESKNSAILTIPCTIALLVMILIAGGSKFIYNSTRVSSLFASFSGVIQIFSVCLALFFLTGSSQGTFQFAESAKTMLITALSVNFVISLVGFYLLKADLFSDSSFFRHFYGLRNQEGGKFYIIVTLVAILMLISNQFVEILFSNLFNLRCFSFKLQNFSELLRHNYLRFASLLTSGLTFTAGFLSILSIKQKSVSNNQFLGLLDMCIVTTFCLASTLKITFRNKQDYEPESKQITIDINEQISHQPVSDTHQFNQPIKNNHKSPNKFRSPGKSIILNGSKKKTKLVQEANQTHQCAEPLNHNEILFTEDQLEEKDLDEHSNNLNQTRITTKIHVTKQKQNINQVNRNFKALQGQQTQPKLTKVRSNHRQRSKPIKSHIGSNQSEDLKQQIQSYFSLQQIKILKRIQHIDQIYSKLIQPEQNESQANLNLDSSLSLADKMKIIIKSKAESQKQFDRQTQLAIQQLDLSVDLLAYKKVTIESMLEYFELMEKEEREVLQQNRCSNLTTPYGGAYIKNQTLISKGSRYNSRDTRKRTKKRKSNFREGAKMFLEKEADDISPYVADFYANHQLQAENCQLQNEEIDEGGNIQADNYLSTDHKPLALMRGKGSNSLENTGGEQIYEQFKNNKYNVSVDIISRSQEVEATQSYLITNKKISCSIPLTMKIDPEREIPQSCQLDEDNVGYLQTDRYGGTQMKPFDLQEQANEHFENNFVNRKREELNDSTPCKPRVQVVESRIVCESSEVLNQFKEDPLSHVMNRYGTRQTLSIKKRRLPSLTQIERISNRANKQNN